MPRKNRYKKVAHFFERKMRTILKCFASDINASETSLLSKLSRPTINKIYCKLRQRIVHESLEERKEKGVFELDESYFGAKRVRGKRGRGATGKNVSFRSFKERWQSLCVSGTKLLQRRAYANYPGQNTGRIRSPYGWMESVQWTYFEWIHTP